MEDLSENDLKIFYRKVFNTEAGRIVLLDILNDLHAFDLYLQNEFLPLVNYSKVLMWKVGINDNEPKQILNKLLELEPVLKEE